MFFAEGPVRFRMLESVGTTRPCHVSAPPSGWEQGVGLRLQGATKRGLPS